MAETALLAQVQKIDSVLVARVQTLVVEQVASVLCTRPQPVVVVPPQVHSHLIMLKDLIVSCFKGYVINHVGFSLVLKLNIIFVSNVLVNIFFK